MRVLIDHPQPFLLAHGGLQVQIEQTKAALEKRGVDIEFLKWWDASQRGDIIHFFGLPSSAYASLARIKGVKIVITQLLGGLGARSKPKRFFQRLLIRTLCDILPEAARGRLGWLIWETADAYVAVTSWEAKLMNDVFRVPRERIHVVPNGVSEIFFQPPNQSRGRYLVTTASILPVKRLIETASAALVAKTPYWIIGRPLADDAAYFREFSALCRRNPEILRYDAGARLPHELAAIYMQARGFVLLSRWETQSLSALEAAAMGCPLLLSDLPWARATFGETASYCPITSTKKTARRLREFYDGCPNLPPARKPSTWDEIASMLINVYRSVLESA